MILPARTNFECCRTAVSERRFAEGGKKNVPEPLPLPSEYGEQYLRGLQTQS